MNDDRQISVNIGCGQLVIGFVAGVIAFILLMFVAFG